MNFEDGGGSSSGVLPALLTHQAILDDQMNRRLGRIETLLGGAVHAIEQYKGEPSHHVEGNDEGDLNSRDLMLDKLMKTMRLQNKKFVKRKTLDIWFERTSKSLTQHIRCNLLTNRQKSTTKDKVFKQWCREKETRKGRVERMWWDHKLQELMTQMEQQQKIVAFQEQAIETYKNENRILHESVYQMQNTEHDSQGRWLHERLQDAKNRAMVVEVIRECSILSDVLLNPHETSQKFWSKSLRSPRRNLLKEKSNVDRFLATIFVRWTFCNALQRMNKASMAYTLQQQAQKRARHLFLLWVELLQKSKILKHREIIFQMRKELNLGRSVLYRWQRSARPQPLSKQTTFKWGLFWGRARCIRRHMGAWVHHMFRRDQLRQISKCINHRARSCTLSQTVEAWHALPMERGYSKYLRGKRKAMTERKHLEQLRKHAKVWSAVAKQKSRSQWKCNLCQRRMAWRVRKSSLQAWRSGMQQREWLRRVGGQCWAGRWRSRARAVLKEWRWEVQRSPGPVLRGLGKEGNDPNVLDDLYIQPACSPCTQSPERLFNQQRGMGPNGLKLLSARFIRLEAEEEGEDTTATKEKANEILCAGEKSGLNGVEEDHFDAESISGPPLPVAELEDRPTACDSPILPTPLRPRSEAWTPASMPLLRRSQLGEATNESPERGGGDFQAWRSSEVTAWLSGSNQEAATAPGNEYSRGAADAFKVVDMDVSGMRNVSTGLNLGENGKKGEQEELEPVLGVCKQDLQGFTRVVSKSRQASSKETRSPETGSNRARVRRWLECFVDSQSNFAAKRELFEGSVLSSTERGLQWIGEEGVADEYSDVGEAKHGVQDDAQCGEVPNDINMTEISKVTVGPATIGMPITEVFRGTYDELPELQMSKRNLLPSNWVLGSLDTQMFEVDEEESISSSMYDSRSKRDQTYDFRDMRAISVAGGQSEGSLWWESALEREADEMLRRAMFQWRRVREKGLWLKWEEERIVVCEEAWILAAVVKVWTQIVQKRRDNAFVLSESEKKQASLTADKGNNVDIVTNNVAEPGVQNRELVKALENRVVEVVQLHGELEQAMSRVEMEVKRRMALEIDCGMEVMRREELESKLAKLEKLLAEAREVREGESMEIEKTAEKLVGLLGGEEWEGNDGKVEKSEAWTLTETWDDGDVDRTSLEIANESMQKSVAVLEAELMRFRALQQQELEQKSWTVRWVETSTMTDGGNELDVLGNWRERTEIRDATTMTDEAETASLTPLIAPEMVKGIAITDALRVEETKAMEHESVMTMTDWSWMGMVEIPGMAEWDRMDEGDSMNLMTEILGDCEGADLIRGGSTLVRASESVEQRRADEALETRLQGCEDVMADEVGEMRGLLVGLKEQVMGSTVQLHDTLQVPLSPSEPSVLPHRQTRALVLGNDALDCCASPDGQRLKRCDANAVGQKARPANLSPGLAPVANHEIPGHVEGMVSSTEGGPGHGSVLSPDLRQGPKAEPGHHSPNSPPGPFVVWVEWLARPAQLRRLRAVWAKWELATFPVEPAEFPGVAQETAHSLGRATRGGSGIAETRPIGDVVTELGAGLARRSPCGALAVEEHAGPRGPVPPLRLKCPRPPADSSGARIGQQGGNEGEPVVRLARAPFKRGRRWGAGQAPLEQVHKNE